jgi:hypothetical protein
MNPAPSKYSVKYFARIYNQLTKRITADLKEIEQEEGAG